MALPIRVDTRRRGPERGPVARPRSVAPQRGLDNLINNIQRSFPTTRSLPLDNETPRSRQITNTIQQTQSSTCGGISATLRKRRSHDASVPSFHLSCARRPHRIRRPSYSTAQQQCSHNSNPHFACLLRTLHRRHGELPGRCVLLIVDSCSRCLSASVSAKGNVFTRFDILSPSRYATTP